MSAQVQLGWNNQQLINGSNTASGIVDRWASRTQGVLSGIGTGVGFGVFDQLTDGIGAAGSAIYQATLQADSLEGGMIALTGSVEAASKRLDEMRQLAKDPGLGFAQVVEGDIALRSVGLSAQLSTRAMREFGNALAVVGKGKADLDGVLLAVTQIVSKGKVSAEEINQIAERVPQIRKVMQEAFGTADTEAIQKMGIPVERFIEMVVSAFEKTVPRALTRMQGKIDNFTDAATARFADFGAGIAEHFVGPLDEATKKLEESSTSAKSFGSGLGTVAGGALALGRTLFSAGKFAADGLGQMAQDIAYLQLDIMGFQRVERQTAEETLRMRDAELAAARVAADLQRHQDQLAEATKKVAEAHKEAAKRANERGIEEAKLTAKIIKATNAARDRFIQEREQTADAYLSTEEKIEKVKARILDIDRQLNATLGQKGGEEISYKLQEEREKQMQSLLNLSKQFNDEQSKDQKAGSKDAQKLADQERSIALYDMELAIAEAAARGQDRKVEKLQREKEIIEETARFVEEMGIGYDEAFQKAEALVNAQARADARGKGETGPGSTIRGYSQSQGDATDARQRADRRGQETRQNAADAVTRSFGTFDTIDAAQKQKFGSLFGNSPAENGPAKPDGGISELTSTWSEWGQRTLELFEKAMQ